MTTPQVWHYGLMAERWAEFLTDAPELPYYQAAIERFGQPVLDVGCGTGRLLLPLLRAGIDIDGADISGDMLRHCQAKANSENLKVHLYQQPMYALDLPRKYRTIYICGSFGLSSGRDGDLETLHRCFMHLEEGGALVFNIQAEYASPDSWDGWLPEKRKGLPEPWPEKGEGKMASDGSVHFAQFRLLEADPLDQSYVREVRLEKWVNGKMVAKEEYVLRGDMYLKHEVVLMLKTAGFQEILVQGDYTDQPATADHEEIVFTAIRK